ncbi:hypothetical protein [Sorangium cellulosum]|uniref:hypothetical protein n=1 Tax=Sorangium cellulosum TaxID=56 RepID=UPI001F3602E4|nr:hypothetical protein [Sorangium cellulosum]
MIPVNFAALAALRTCRAAACVAAAVAAPRGSPSLVGSLSCSLSLSPSRTLISLALSLLRAPS